MSGQCFDRGRAPLARPKPAAGISAGRLFLSNRRKREAVKPEERNPNLWETLQRFCCRDDQSFDHHFKIDCSGNFLETYFRNCCNTDETGVGSVL